MRAAECSVNNVMAVWHVMGCYNTDYEFVASICMPQFVTSLNRASGSIQIAMCSCRSCGKSLTGEDSCWKAMCMVWRFHSLPYDQKKIRRAHLRNFTISPVSISDLFIPLIVIPWITIRRGGGEGIKCSPCNTKAKLEAKIKMFKDLKDIVRNTCIRFQSFL